MQLPLFDCRHIFTPRSRGIVTWFDLSINEKINFKSHNFHNYIDRPYSCGTVDAMSAIEQNNLADYISWGETEKPNHKQLYGKYPKNWKP